MLPAISAISQNQSWSLNGSGFAETASYDGYVGDFTSTYVPLTITPDRDVLDYRRLERIRHATTFENFSNWRGHVAEMTDLARYAYENGELLQADLLIRGYKGEKYAQAITEIKNVENDWLEFLELFPLPENPAERRQTMEIALLNYDNNIWDAHEKKWQDIVKDLTDDELHTLYIATRLRGFLDVDKNKFTDYDTAVIDTMDFVRSGRWLCETITLWTLHLIKRAGVRMNVIFPRGHVTSAIATKASGIIIFDDGLHLLPVGSRRLARSQKKADGSPNEGMVFPPERVLSATIMNSIGYLTNGVSDWSAQNSAAHYAQAALNLTPQLALANLYAGITSFPDPDRRRMHEAFQRAIELDPDEGIIRYHYGIALMRIPEASPEEAIRQFEASLLLDHSESQSKAACHIRIANLYARQPGQQVKQIKHLRASLQFQMNESLKEWVEKTLARLDPTFIAGGD